MVTARRVKKRLSEPIKNAPVCAGLLELLGYRVPRSAHGLKKAKTAPTLERTLVDSGVPEFVELELDELWSFVRAKSCKRWLWLAVCKHTRQVVACVVGGRSIATCEQLWRSVPDAYKQGIIFSDFWEAYRAVIPDGQHQPVGKETGLTAHVERFNNTIRQRLARFVRKTLSFSKSESMHLICLHLFLVRYNLDLKAGSLR